MTFRDFFDAYMSVRLEKNIFHREKMKKRNKELEQIIELTERLITFPTTRHVEVHREYNTNKGCGEIDVFVVRNSGLRVYYEIKSRFCKQSYLRAVKQFKRAYKCNQADRFVYVTPERIMRYRINEL